MKHVCFIELMPIPQTIGGVPTHLLELSRHLSKLGWKISIISGKSSKPFKQIPGISIYQVGIPHKPFDDFKGIKKIFYFFWRIAFETAFIFGALKKIKKLNPDMINSESLITHSIPAVLSGKKFVVTEHGINSMAKFYKIQGENFVSNIISTFFVPLMKFNAKRSSKIICLGIDTYNFYSKWKDSVIITNGVDNKKFAFKNKKRNKTIIFAGRFSPQKSPDKIIKAMDYLPEYNLLVVGLGPLENEMRKLCSERKNCRFLGYKNHEELAELFNKSSFIVLPSEFEGLPIVMLEAMACGVIPIATRVGDNADVIQERISGFLLKDNNPRTIAETVKKASKMKLSKIRQNAVKEIEKNYSWDNIAKKYSEVYAGVIGK